MFFILKNLKKLMNYIQEVDQKQLKNNMKNIFVINNSNKLNNSYIFSFNLSSFLGKNDKKVLLLSSTLTTNELIINNIDARKILSKNVIPPFFIF